ncbi:MAG: thiol:disulfide interchange protein DsbA/DsbL [Gammaproteobacteria bacterium]|nr:thiol:disulfide interchange protein DsbA/DsbL [Gammaproteobacteria bacterium]
MRFTGKPLAALVAWQLLLASPLASSSAYAIEELTAGKHYEVLPLPVATADPAKIEVVEMFSYACVHCFTFDPSLEGWRSAAPADVSFRRTPAVFNKDWELLAQVYYAAEVLNIIDKVHTPVFNALHMDSVDLRDPERVAALFEKHAGIKSDQFNDVYNSFSVRSRVQQAIGKGKAYRITGVPTLIVNGKYRVDGQLAGNNTKMLEVVDFLIAKERAGTAGKPQAVTQ